jgi:hypothetical protein
MDYPVPDAGASARRTGQGNRPDEPHRSRRPFHLLAGSLCASTVVEDLRWYFGWDTEALDPAVVAMLYSWERLRERPRILFQFSIQARMSLSSAPPAART